MNSNIARSLAIVAGAAALGLAAAGLISGLSTADAEPGQTPVTTAPAEPFQTNAAGQTFGRYRIGDARPDFVPGWTDEKVHGWFRTDDWVPQFDVEGNPAAATGTVTPDANGDIRIRVYAFDGKTVLGWATVAHASSE